MSDLEFRPIQKILQLTISSIKYMKAQTPIWFPYTSITIFHIK